MEKELSAALHTATNFLEKNKFKYVLIGGVAVAQWGYIRATNDVDFKVLISDTDYVRAAKIIRSEFPKRARQNLPENPLIVSVFVEGVIVDFLLSIPGYEEQMILRAEQRMIAGKQVWLCQVEDLLIQKVVSGRPKDWLDIDGLLTNRYGNLDHKYIEDWLAQFAEALAEPDFLQKYLKMKKRIDDLARDDNFG